MANLVNRLTARQVSSIKKPGMHNDGGGLYLSEQPSLSKQWVYIFQWCKKKRKETGLGSAMTVSLAEDREAVAARALEFTILTAARASETLGTRWSEIDLAEGV